MASLFNQTNINTGRYFFATQLDGEQQLFISTTGVAPAQNSYIGITGSGGNEVLISQLPTLEGTDWISGGDAVFAGTNSQYLTLSTLATTSAGASISIDRLSGSGVTCIENYGTNGALKGFEFLSRGVNSELISTVYADTNNYISSLGRPGATAILAPTGTFLTGAHQGAVFDNIQSVAPNGAGCYNISDLSGGSSSTGRWSMGKFGATPGSNVGSDLAFFAYQDDGQFLGNWMSIKRSDGAIAIQNISSVNTTVPSGGSAPVFPASKTNVEFGADPNGVAVVTGGSFSMLFSTPITGLDPTTQTLLNINFVNSLSSGADTVTYKVGFSTNSAYTNILQTSYVPGLAASWTPSDQPGATTPIGATNICAMLDSDGINPDGSGFLYVEGQLTAVSGADQLFIKKGVVTESTRNSLVFRPV